MERRGGGVCVLRESTQSLSWNSCSTTLYDFGNVLRVFRVLFSSFFLPSRIGLWNENGAGQWISSGGSSSECGSGTPRPFLIIDAAITGKLPRNPIRTSRASTKYRLIGGGRLKTKTRLLSGGTRSVARCSSGTLHLFLIGIADMQHRKKETLRRRFNQSLLLRRPTAAIAPSFPTRKKVHNEVRRGALSRMFLVSLF